MATNLQRLIGRRLAEIRQQREITREQLAETSGLELTFIVQIEAGERTVGVGDLTAIAGALGVPLASILAEH